jgi:hypothetical protein
MMRDFATRSIDAWSRGHLPNLALGRLTGLHLPTQCRSSSARPSSPRSEVQS